MTSINNDEKKSVVEYGHEELESKINVIEEDYMRLGIDGQFNEYFEPSESLKYDSYHE